MIHHSSGKCRLLRKIFSMCLALIMICSVCVPAFAVSKDSGTEGDMAGQPVPEVTYNFYVEGELYESQTVKDGDTLTEPAAPMKDGSVFDGWYTAQDGGEKFINFSQQTVTETTVVDLYAGWTQIQEAESGENTDAEPERVENESTDQTTDANVLTEEEEELDSAETQADANEELSTLAISGESTVQVGETITLRGSGGIYHKWSSEDGDGRITFTGRTDGSSVKVRGEHAGTVTVTHSYRPARWNPTVTESYTVTVLEEGTYNLYIYTLIPGVEMGSSGDPNNVWNGMTVGTISNVGSPTNKKVDEILYSGDNTIKAQSNINFNDADYPSIEFNGERYQYARTEEEKYQAGYYTIQWIRVIVANGANAGNNNRIPVVPSSEDSSNYTYHLDGMLMLNEKDMYTVNFALRDAESNDFVIVEPEVYSTRVEAGFAASELHRPDRTAPNKYPMTKVVDGITYKLDGWYKDEKCTDPVEWDTEKITQNITYYAQYVPAGKDITIEKKVTGSLGDVQKEFAFTCNYQDASGNVKKEDFSLRNGGLYTLSNVPIGTTLTLIENNAEGYTTSVEYGNAPNNTAAESKDSSQKTLNIKITGDSGKIIVTNQKEAIPDTGIHMDSLPYLLILLLFLAGTSGWFVYRYRRHIR